MFRYFLSREFFLTLAVFVGVGLLAYWYVFSIYLPDFTGHNKTVAVPNIEQKSFEEAKKKLQAAGLNLEVKDSIYNPSFPALTVLKQYPADSMLIKPGRTVLLTLNKKLPTSTKMPKVVDHAIYQAKEMLATKKLVLKEVRTVPDVAKNIVLKASLEDGRVAEPGMELPQGTRIILTIGGGGSEAAAPEPEAPKK